MYNFEIDSGVRKGIHPRHGVFSVEVGRDLPTGSPDSRRGSGDGSSRNWSFLDQCLNRLVGVGRNGGGHGTVVSRPTPGTLEVRD